MHFSGNLAPGSTTTTVNSIGIFDEGGAPHTLTATFTNNTSVTPGSYLVTVTDETGATVGTGEVRFQPDGTPQAGFSSMNLNLTYGDTAQTVALSFGTPGALDGMTSLAGMSSNASAKVDDGHGVLSVTDLSFNDRGVLQLVYSQTERRDGPQRA